MARKEKMNYEDALCELEQIVSQLESGELTLDASIEVFQRGIELSKFCSKKLDEIEKKVTVLLEGEKGEVKEVEFKVDKSMEDR